jgi:hypothetical protein
VRGEFLAVWTSMWKEVWCPLFKHTHAKEDLFCELYRAANEGFKVPFTVEKLADIIDDPAQSRRAFRRVPADSWSSERALVGFLEATHTVLIDFDGDELANTYFNLLRRFTEKYNLRYELRRPCLLCPTLPGMFASLIHDVRISTRRDAHLRTLMRDFDESVRDLRFGATDNRIKTCIQKQVNLLEAIGRAVPGVTGTSFTEMCNQVEAWPHERVRQSLKDLYHFTCDYPGIRHAGSPDNVLRKMDMRDMVAVSILLAGFTPYLAGELDAQSVYFGA